MKIIPLLLVLSVVLVSVLFFLDNKGGNYNVELKNEFEKDIILVNLGEADREKIADILLKIDSCQPSVIGLDVFFFSNRDIRMDSILENALIKVKNEIIPYSFDSSGSQIGSLPRFRTHARGEGYTDLDVKNGLASHFTPIKDINGNNYESFALRIVKIWKNGFVHKFKNNKSIPIKFTQTLDQFFHFDATEFNNIEKDSIKNKVILMGYIGPSDEDKKFTPIRLVRKYSDGIPDTYGLVIIANEIKTILDCETR